MAIYTLPQDSGINFSEGVHTIFVYIAQQVPIFIPSVLFAFFMIVFTTGYFLQAKREGKGDLPQWFAIAGYLTSIVALVMILIDGLIPVYVVTIVMAVTFMGTIWFFLSKNKE